MRRKDKTVKALAYFWRYGWIVSLLISTVALSLFLDFYRAFGLSIMMFGIYSVIIAALCCEHFICGMQNAYHMKMTPYQSHTKAWLTKIKREGIIIGLIFSVLGLILMFVEQ